jgi:microcystin-dependent protein
MSRPEQLAKIDKIYHSVKVYKNAKQDWVRLSPIDMGDIKYSCQGNDHGGWMLCDGRSLSREEYSDLFVAIGTAFGSVSGTTFNLPDARGRVLGAIGSGAGLTARSLGDTVGAETHTLTTGEMPSHNHGVTDPGHAHSYTNNTNDQNVNTLTTQDSAADNADLGQTTGSSTTGVTINNTGGDGAHNNMQPTEFIGNVFIFAKYTDYI